MATVTLAIDQGTTSSRAILFDSDLKPVATAQRELRQFFPRDGWVEQDPEDIWNDTRAVCRAVLARIERNATVAALGITNQRETVVVWDRATGQAVHNAIVWQDRRTAPLCDVWKAEGLEETIRARTGLVIDPYFSASKIVWLLDNVDGVRARAERGELAFGTVDSFLLWRLTGGRVHATDATNAARTMLFDIHVQDWSDDLLQAFRIPRALLPEVMDTAAEFGTAGAEVLGTAMPIRAMAGDQHAATVGQGCFEPGSVKSTYGTGCFMVLNTGTEPVASVNRLLTTLAYRLDGTPTYALEGSVFNTGTAVQWLRDGLGLIDRAEETEALARLARSTGGAYLVPAFTGLGAPYWDPGARGAIVGLTRDSGRAELCRAALEAVAYQSRDLLDAMTGDYSRTPADMKVDGGMVVNDWLMQFLADILETPVDRPEVIETTALGAAYLAGWKAGAYPPPETFAATRAREARFEPQMDPATREGLYSGWKQAVARVRTSGAD